MPRRRSQSLYTRIMREVAERERAAFWDRMIAQLEARAEELHNPTPAVETEKPAARRANQKRRAG